MKFIKESERIIGYMKFKKPSCGVHTIYFFKGGLCNENTSDTRSALLRKFFRGGFHVLPLYNSLLE